MGGENCTIMKTPSHADMHEGPVAFDRFRKALRAIVGVPKTTVVPTTRKTEQPKRKPRVAR